VDSTALQDDLNKLYNWSQEWQMTFNVEKLGVNERKGLKLFGREIIFEEFQPI